MKKYLIILMTLISFSTITWAEELLGNKAPLDPSLQEKAFDPEGYSFEVGDTIIINKASERYLTGERMSTWVYFVRHRIQQVGGTRFPNGILIQGIYSWVGPEDLLLIRSANPTPEAAARQAADAAQVEERIQDYQQLTEEQREDIGHRTDIFDATETLTPDTTQTVEPEPIPEAPKEVVVITRPEAAYIVTGKPDRHTVDRFTIGLRGGVASLLHNTINDTKWNAGWDVLLDLQYAHYWQKYDGKPLLGLLVGAGIGYSRSHLSGNINDKYSVRTTDGPIDYTVTADNVKEYDGQLQLEVPVMFSMIHKGFFLNVGPRLAVPVYSNYNQQISNPHVNAYFPEEGVNVPDELITGVVTKDKADTKGKWSASKINVMLGAELGYEFTFKNRNSLGLGVYANYSVYTYYKNDTENKSLVDLTVPGAATPVQVNVSSATDTYAKGLGYFDVGLKLAYHFNWWKTKPAK